MNLIEELTKQQNENSMKQVRGRFINQLNMLSSNFDKDYTISQLLHTLLRKQEDREDPYFWSDEKMLKKCEELYKKLVKEAQNER